MLLNTKLFGISKSWLFVAVLLLGACTGSSDDDNFEDDVPQTPKLPYQTKFEGELPGDVTSYLRSASQAAQGESKPPSSLIVLRKRAENDIPRIEAGLRAQGYYDGTVSFRIEQEEPEKNEEGETEEEGVIGTVSDLITGPPTSLIYEIEPGQRFVFAERSIDVSDATPDFEAPGFGDLGLKAGEPAIAQKVLDAEQLLVTFSNNNGYPFARIADREAIVDFDRKTMDINLVLEPGEPATFGSTSFTGIEGVDEDFVRKQISYEIGEVYDTRKLNRTRQQLIETQLFSTILVEPSTELTETGELPVDIEVRQRKHRTIGVGAGVNTDEGPNGRIFWEHRNVLNRGYKFKAEISGSQSRQELKGQFRIPDIYKRDTDLIADASAKNEQTDAFDSRSIGAGVGFETQYNNHISATLGVAYRYAEIEEDGQPDNVVGLFSMPASVSFDYSDNLLDPTEGWRLQINGAPFWDTLNVGTTFLRSRATATTYYKLANEPRLIFALRGSAGSIFGADRDEIPADERFYAGGGGSVRGIPFQLAGELNDGEPIGGRSVIEGSAELRWRAFQSLEFAGFFDGGTVYESVVPDFESDLEFGVGTGIRYVTPIGPIRFDVAIPVDRRSGIDDPFQIYISIGQAF